MATGSRGQSEVLGTALLLGITVLSIALVVSIAGTALDSTRDTTDVESAEHAMSQLDSRGALVALGRTESQSISMGRARSGSYYVDEDAGRITITHKDYNVSNGDEVLYNEPLGALVYEHGDTTVAYQGGGVWRSDGGGGSTLVSPPEFHYRGETLTIPIIRVRSPNGGGSASGSVSAHLERNQGADPIYPSGETYTDPANPYANPIQNGTIQVTVQSEYYQAWGSFFRSRTEGNVTVYDSNQTAVVELVVPAVEGEFRMPLDGDSIRLRGVGGKHAVTDLNLTLAPDDSDSANFANLKWSLYAEDGSKKLELHIRSSGGKPGCGDGYEDDVQGTIYYTNGSGTYQGWKNESAFPVVCNDLDGDGDDEARIVANWSDTTDFNYSTLSSSDLHYFNPSGSLQDPVTFDDHPADDPIDEHTYSVDDTEDVNFTVSHYAAFFGPTLEFTVSDSGGGGGTVNEDVSSGRVEYGGAEGSFVTYIHATENSVNVTLTA